MAGSAVKVRGRATRQLGLPPRGRGAAENGPANRGRPPDTCCLGAFSLERRARPSCARIAPPAVLERGTSEGVREAGSDVSQSAGRGRGRALSFGEEPAVAAEGVRSAAGDLGHC